MTFPAMIAMGLDARTMHGLRDPHAGAERHRPAVLDQGQEGLAVADIRHPVIEAAVEQIGVGRVDSDWRAREREFPGEDIGRTGPHLLHRRMTAENLEILL